MSAAAVSVFPTGYPLFGGEIPLLVTVSESLSLAELVSPVTATLDISEALALAESIALTASVEVAESLTLSETTTTIVTITVNEQLNLDITSITLEKFSGVEFGGWAFPFPQEVSIIKPRIYSEQPIPKRDYAYREDLGGFGDRIKVQGFIHPFSAGYMNILAKLADGTARTLDLKLEGGPSWSAALLHLLEFGWNVERPNRIDFNAQFAEQNNP